MKRAVFIAQAILLVLFFPEDNSAQIEVLSATTDSLVVSINDENDNPLDFYTYYRTLYLGEGVGWVRVGGPEKRTGIDYYLGGDGCAGALYLSGPQTYPYSTTSQLADETIVEALGTVVCVYEDDPFSSDIIDTVYSDTLYFVNPDSIHWWYTVDTEIQTQEAVLNGCQDLEFQGYLEYLDDTIIGWDNNYGYYDTTYFYTEYWNVENPEIVFQTEMFEPVPGENALAFSPIDVSPGTYEYRTRADISMTWDGFQGGTVEESIYGETLEVTVEGYSPEYSLSAEILSVEFGNFGFEGCPVFINTEVSQSLELGEVSVTMSYVDEFGNEESGIDFGTHTAIGQVHPLSFAYDFFEPDRQYTATLNFTQVINDPCNGFVFLGTSESTIFTTPVMPVIVNESESSVELENIGYTDATFSFSIEKNDALADGRVRYYAGIDLLQESLFDANDEVIQFTDTLFGLTSNIYHDLHVVAEVFDIEYETWINAVDDYAVFTTLDDTPTIQISNISWNVVPVTNTEAIFDLSFNGNGQEMGVLIELRNVFDDEVLYSEYNESFTGYSLSETISVEPFSSYEWYVHLAVTDIYWETEEEIFLDPESFETLGTAFAVEEFSFEVLSVSENDALVSWTIDPNSFEGNVEGYVEIVDDNEFVFDQYNVDQTDLDEFLYVETTLENLETDLTYDLKACYWITHIETDSVSSGCSDFLTITPTSVLEKETTEILIYPNPASDVIYLQGLSEPTNAWVVNGEGKKVKKIQLVSGKNEISISNLPTGLYTILFDGKRNLSPERFIK